MKTKLPTIIDAVEFRRDQYGYTKTQMAFELGMCLSHYSEFIHRKRPLPLKARIKAHKIGVPAEVLLQGVWNLCDVKQP